MSISISEIERTILECVRQNGAIKGVDLALDVMHKINPCRLDTEMYLQSLERLIQSGELVVIEYVKHGSEYCITKSIYFPKGTIHRVVSQTDKSGVKI